MRILLVEDDPSVAASVIDGLVNAAMEVDHVSTGKEAISKALDSPLLQKIKIILKMSR